MVVHPVKCVKRTHANLLILAAAILLGAAAPPPAASPARPASPVPTPGQIVASAAAGEWVDIAAADLLVMDLAPDRDPGSGAGAGGNAQRVVIQLMPPPFSQGWVGNIRKLAAAHWWDGTSINRVQDNYVAQWGDANAEDKAKAKALPTGLVKVLQSNYASNLPRTSAELGSVVATGTGLRLFGEHGSLPPPTLDKQWDVYATVVGFAAGWPIAWAAPAPFQAWPVHCYGMVGVGRDMPPDTGTGAELYTVIGHAPRHLDRNIALVGRVIAGIEQLSSLQRGTGPLGFYDKPEQRVPIVTVRMGNEVAGLPRYQYLSTESATFARYADARANRRDAFFVTPAGGADICNVPVPVRTAP